MESNGKLPHLFIPSKPWFLSLRLKACLWAELPTAPGSQDQLKWLLSDGSTEGHVVSKVLIPQP